MDISPLQRALGKSMLSAMYAHIGASIVKRPRSLVKRPHSLVKRTLSLVKRTLSLVKRPLPS